MKLVIDTDMAFGTSGADIDDALALLFAFSLDDFEVLSIISSGGNAPPGNVSHNVDALLKRIGKADVPHSFSISRPLDASFWIGERWSKHKEEKIERKGELPDSVTLLRESVMSADSVTIATIGPMTNLAIAVTQFPEIKDHIERVVSMGGSIYETGVAGGPAEFNIKTDPEAAALVLASGLKVSLFPLDVTKKKKIFPESIASWFDYGDLINDLAKASIAFMKYRAKRDGYDTPYAFFHDVLPIVYLVKPELFKMKECFASVDLKGTLTRGVTVFDFKKTGHAVAVDVDSQGVFKLVEKRILDKYGAY